MKRNTNILAGVMPAMIAITILTCAPAWAQITAQTYRAVEPRTGYAFLDWQPNLQTTGASTTKAMTMHLALKAIQQGKIRLNDSLYISANSLTFACTCWASAGQSGAVHNLSGGEMFSVDDALYGTDESAVEPTVSLAEYVANVLFNGVKSTGGTNIALSNVLLQQFISLMNLEAGALGMTQTFYTTVFGGAAELTSAPDMATLWINATKDPQFIVHTGFRQHAGTIHVLKNGVYQPQNYVVGKAYTYYPNIDGDKNGGWNGVACCFESQSTRGGRTLLGTMLGSVDGFNDIAKILQGGFQVLFTPSPWMNANLGSSVMQVSTASASAQRAVTAQTHGNGKMDLLVWNLDVANAKVVKAGGAWSKVTGATDVAVANIRNNFAATLVQSNGSIILSGWDIDAAGVPTETSSITLAAVGSSPRIVTIGVNTFAVAYISNVTAPILGVYTVGSEPQFVACCNGPAPASPITAWGTSGAWLGAKEIDIAGGPVSYGGPTQVVLAAHKISGGTSLLVYSLDFSDNLNFNAQLDEQDLSSVSLGRTGIASSVYRLAGVDPVSQHARIFFFTTAGNSLSITGHTDYSDEPSAITRVAGLGGSDTSAQLISLNTGGELRLSSHDIDVRDGNPPNFAPFNLLGSNEGAPTVNASAMAMTPIYDPGSAGTYLVVTNTWESAVQLLVYRVGWQ